jgi:hypothetical protein
MGPRSRIGRTRSRMPFAKDDRKLIGESENNGRMYSFAYLMNRIINSVFYSCGPVSVSF